MREVLEGILIIILLVIITGLSIGLFYTVAIYTGVLGLLVALIVCLGIVICSWIDVSQRSNNFR